MVRRYPCRPRWGMLIGGAGFFAIAAAVLGYVALTTESTGERVLFGVLAVASAGFVPLAVAGLIVDASGKRVVVLDDTTITVPIGLRGSRTLVLAEIVRVEWEDVLGEELATFVTPRAKAWIHKQRLGAAAFQDILARVRSARPPG